MIIEAARYYIYVCIFLRTLGLPIVSSCDLYIIIIYYVYIRVNAHDSYATTVYSKKKKVVAARHYVIIMFFLVYAHTYLYNI